MDGWTEYKPSEHDEQLTAAATRIGLEWLGRESMCQQG